MVCGLVVCCIWMGMTFGLCDIVSRAGLGFGVGLRFAFGFWVFDLFGLFGFVEYIWV